MSLALEIQEALKNAMRAKDKVRLEALRSIKSAILLAQTESGAQAELSEAQELKLLQKLQKQRKDSLEIYQQQNRPELAEEEQAQLLVVEEFLPQAMAPEELRAALEKIVAETGATGPQDMGKVMGKANQVLAGKADGKSIAAIVKELLQS